MMSILAVLLAALLPSILLWLYIWKQDPQQEPTSWLVKAALYGAGICIPVAIVEALIDNAIFGGEPTTLLGTTVQAFFVAALPEKSFKLLAKLPLGENMRKYISVIRNMEVAPIWEFFISLFGIIAFSKVSFVGNFFIWLLMTGMISDILGYIVKHVYHFFFEKS